ncbi:peptidoglycan-binding domain-containing protein [Streptomyces sp. NPDC006552]|uniref:peptidoglycan-binding domain-containing protein n=1 Tax=Streptomyces sp. NPDC006552 TaxID=3157179 RepID=UPI0033BC1F3E
MEGFSPLRVRPYVTLPEPSQPPPPRVPDPYAHPPLPPERPPARTGEPAGHADDPGARPRRAPVLLLAAVAGVLSVAALVTVLISSGDGDTGAAAQQAATPLVTSAAPSRPTRSASATPSRATKAPAAAASSTRPAPPPASAPASSSVPPSGTPSSSRTHPAPGPSASTASGQPRPERGTVLRRGDHGPEVSELQYRLGKLNLFGGAPDGRFDTRTEYGVRAYQLARGVQGDIPGTYGPATREALEGETR